MKRFLVAVAVLAAATHGSSSTRAEPSAPRFSEPNGPDRAEIELRSDGCFFHSSASITVFRNRPYARVASGDEVAWLELSIEDLAGLDRLFDFYRVGPPQDCTTVDEVEVEWFRGDAKIAVERFADGSCLAGRPIDPQHHVEAEIGEAAARITFTLGDLLRRAAIE